MFTQKGTKPERSEHLGLKFNQAIALQAFRPS
jgi:hypothetical protein